MDISEPHTKIPLIIGIATVATCWWIVTEFTPQRTTVSEPAHAPEPADTHDEAITDLQFEVRRLKGQVALQMNRYKSATFDPSDESFQRIDSDVASFAVSLSNLQPYGDGSRITVKLGNPSAASFANVKLKLRYGPRWPQIDDPKFAEKYAEAEAQTKTKEVTLVKQVVGGSWNPNQVTLPGIKPDVLGFVEIGIETDAIYLNQK